MNIIFKPECKTEIIKPTYDLPIIGEPISKTGASANNSNAYGVIVGIIGDGSSRRVRVMTEGYIDYDKVKENYMEYTDEAINALTGITLCSGGKLPNGDEWEIIKEISIAEEVSYVEETFAKTYRRFLMRINSPNLRENRTLIFAFNGRGSNTFENNAMSQAKAGWAGELEITDAFIKCYSGLANYYDYKTNIQPFDDNINGQLLARNKDISAMLNAGDKGVYSVKITANPSFLAGDTITFFGVPI